MCLFEHIDEFELFTSVTCVLSFHILNCLPFLARGQLLLMHYYRRKQNSAAWKTLQMICQLVNI